MIKLIKNLGLLTLGVVLGVTITSCSSSTKEVEEVSDFDIVKRYAAKERRAEIDSIESVRLLDDTDDEYIYYEVSINGSCIYGMVDRTYALNVIE